MVVNGEKYYYDYKKNKMRYWKAAICKPLSLCSFFPLISFLKSWPAPLPPPTHCEFELFKLTSGC